MEMLCCFLYPISFDLTIRRFRDKPTAVHTEVGQGIEHRQVKKLKRTFVS